MCLEIIEFLLFKNWLSVTIRKKKESHFHEIEFGFCRKISFFLLINNQENEHGVTKNQKEGITKNKRKTIKGETRRQLRIFVT